MNPRQALSIRRFFIAAVLTAFVAVVLQSTMLVLSGIALAHLGRANAAGGAERIAIEAKTVHFARLGIFSFFTGLGLAVSSIVLIIVSMRRREPVRHWILLVPLLFYILFQLPLLG